jgi:hypothetical protein
MYGMISSWSTHEKLTCSSIWKITRLSYYKVEAKLFFFIVTDGSYQLITSTERIEMNFLLVKFKGMLYRRYRRVKNCMM